MAKGDAGKSVSKPGGNAAGIRADTARLNQLDRAFSGIKPRVEQMTFRVDLLRTAPKAMEELLSFQQFSGESGLNERLVELVRMYVSQLNQCRQSMEVHARRARTLGETSERISATSSWRSVALFSPRERAAFEWADCVLRPIPRVSDRDYSAAREAFNDAELVDLTVIVVATAAKNRVMISLGNPSQSQPQPGEFLG